MHFERVQEKEPITHILGRPFGEVVRGLMYGRTIVKIELADSRAPVQGEITLLQNLWSKDNTDGLIAVGEDGDTTACRLCLRDVKRITFTLSPELDAILKGSKPELKETTVKGPKKEKSWNELCHEAMEEADRVWAIICGDATKILEASYPITEKTDKKARGLILFFEWISRRYHQESMRGFLEIQANYNRHSLSSEAADKLARQMKICMMQICHKPGKFDDIVELDFTGFNLSFLPPEIGLFTNLRTLKLAGNNLTVLPSSLGNLTKLESLDLAGNSIKNLPKELKNCSRLAYVNLSGNAFDFSTLIELMSADDFLQKPLMAKQVITQAVAKLNKLYDEDASAAFAKGVKKIIKKIFSTEYKNGDLLQSIIEANLSSLQPDSHTAQIRLEILSAFPDCTEAASQMHVDLTNKMIERCIAEAPKAETSSERHVALRELLRLLFVKGYIDKAIEVALLMIKETQAKPDRWGFLHERKYSELEAVSHMLREQAEKLFLTNEVDKAKKIAAIIPLESEKRTLLVESSTSGPT